MQFLPGFGGSPAAPAPLAPLPTREDPAIGETRDKATTQALKSRDRRQAVLTSGQGVEDQLASVSRPSANQLLGS